MRSYKGYQMKSLRKKPPSGDTRLLQWPRRGGSGSLLTVWRLLSERPYLEAVELSEGLAAGSPIGAYSRTVPLRKGE
jgi:hypothetical protein